MWRILQCLNLLLGVVVCNNINDIPYVFEDIPYYGEFEEDTMPYYEFERPTVPLSKRAKGGITTFISSLDPEKLEEMKEKNKHLGLLTVISRPQSTFTPRLGRRKRSLPDSERLEGPENSFQMFPQPFFRLQRRGENVKTISLPSSFTPRLGRKRSDENVGYLRDGQRRLLTGISGRSQQVVSLSAGNAFTPRLGRSGRFKRLMRNEPESTTEKSA